MRILLLDSKAGKGKEHASIPVDDLSAKEFSSSGLILLHVKSSSEMSTVKLDGLNAAIVHVSDDGESKHVGDENRESKHTHRLLEMGVPLVVISNAPALASKGAADLRAHFPYGRLRDMTAYEVGDPLRRCFADRSIEPLFDNPLDLALELLTGLYGAGLQSERSGNPITLHQLSNSPGGEGRILPETAGRLLSTGIMPGLTSEDVFKRFLVGSTSEYWTQLANLRDQLLDTIYSKR